MITPESSIHEMLLSLSTEQTKVRRRAIMLAVFISIGIMLGTLGPRNVVAYAFAIAGAYICAWGTGEARAKLKYIKSVIDEVGSQKKSGNF